VKSQTLNRSSTRQTKVLQTEVYLYDFATLLKIQFDWCLRREDARLYQEATEYSRLRGVSQPASSTTNIGVLTTTGFFWKTVKGSFAICACGTHEHCW